ncbi:MAG TPA: hypothetical protein VMC41_01525, partial [Candidatus Nanoarchaeia archaeon]|nr:hypothetical protein [Candidatus Nanoarchaeia archaeon]
DSYLIHTTANDLNENDLDPAAKTFDTADDRDKVFTANAYSGDDQILHPVSGYAWTWNWSIADKTIVKFVNNNNKPFATDSSAQLIQAQDGVVDARTTAKARINLTDSKISSVGAGYASSSAIYVFMCSSTWPSPVNGTWHPWRDQVDGAKCLAGSGDCNPMNYELYYCLDNGGANTLPSVGQTATRGTNLGCTDAAGSCAGKAVGDACGTGGACQDLLKETFFFSQ